MSERFTLHLGDCLEVLPTLEAESVDAVVTDPPYHLTSISKRFGKAGSAPVDPATGVFARKARGFMGKEWDGGDVAFRPETWAAVLRVMKPGAHLVAFGGSRTFHRIACAIEDAGFELRDTLMWIYATGFPKSLDVSKAIDKLAGASRAVVGNKLGLPGYHLSPHHGGSALGAGLSSSTETSRARAATITSPATAAAAAQGLGTALKPAFEPIILARKPIRESSIARQVLATGTGAINVDACRSDRSDRSEYGLDGDEPSEQVQSCYGKFGKRGAFSVTRKGEPSAERTYADEPGDFTMKPVPRGGDILGRWPANVLHDGSEEACLAMGEARRYFYSTKADRDDREEGLEDAEEKTLQRVNPGGLENDPRWAPVKRRNTHPTVKPADLMRWCARLCCPRGGVILDPFMGSGSTGKAAMLEGFRFVGIELGQEYLDIALARIEDAARDWLEKAKRKAKREGHRTLFDAPTSAEEIAS